ncbi:MAG: hypothetical protein Q9227_008894 [Pyrenula ochraceoflavens]
MSDLNFVISRAKKNSRDFQNDLWNYQNRARVFFHEITHQPYFMDEPGSAPFVDDLKISYGKGKQQRKDVCYGPDNIKILANYEAKNKGGYYTQRNADSFAWFAMAKQVEKQIGSYPSNPQINTVPNRAPTNGIGKPVSASDDEGSNVEAGDYDPDPNAEVPAPKEDDTHWIPGCQDNDISTDITFGEASVNPQPPIGATCDTKSISDIPYNVFYGQNGGVFDSFCFAIDSAQPLNWKVDAHGNQKAPSKRDVLPLPLSPLDQRDDKRTPPPNPDTWNKYTIELDWKPDSNKGCGQSAVSCEDAFVHITDSPCGHQGCKLLPIPSLMLIGIYLTCPSHPKPLQNPKIFPPFKHVCLEAVPH